MEQTGEVTMKVRVCINLSVSIMFILVLVLHNRFLQNKQINKNNNKR